MWSIVRRAISPALLLIGGVIALVYGTLYHRVPVLEETESQTTIDVPLEIPIPSPYGDNSPFDSPQAVIKKTVTRIDRNIKIEPEGTIVREVTVGGVALQESGAIKRTYTGDKGPALCPT
jgi:hypothetical protein